MELQWKILDIGFDDWDISVGHAVNAICRDTTWPVGNFSQDIKRLIEIKI